MKKIVVIGGGTGTYMVLTGLKKYKADLGVIVSMMDSGGSNRVIRDEFGLLPTSDIRQCMVALASEKSHEVLRNLFTYRYNQGTGISGMTFGNLFMAALTDIYGSQEEAIEKTCEILDVQGEILPVTYDNVQLVARYESGQQVLGEHFIDEPKEEMGKERIIDLEVIPKARANEKALSAIKKADLLVLGPGDLYTSIICNLVVDGVADAIGKSKAKKVFVMNLMTKFGETGGLTAKDHFEQLKKYLKGAAVDFVLVNQAKEYPAGVLKRYKLEKAEPVLDDVKGDPFGKTQGRPERSRTDENGLKVVRGNYISSQVFQKPSSDKVRRSLIRHDSDKLAKAIMSLV